MTIQSNNTGDLSIAFINPIDNMIYPGSIAENRLNNDIREYSINFIASVNNTSRMNFVCRVPAGSPLPFGYIIRGWSLTVTNLFTQ